MRIVLLSLAVAFSSAALATADDLPRSRDPRLKIELFAEHPQIVTPTGIDVDHAGRVWAIESNTHFRPQEYKGHPTDRLLVLSDTNGDGRADKIVTFADGFTHAMSVAVRPLWFTDVPQGQAKPKATATASGLSVYLATRREIVLLHDDDGDLKVDRKTPIARLDSKGAYPHNAINGLAFHPRGWLYFGMGENLGAAYKLIGSDGTTLSGGGEGGNMFRCRPDGSKLERIATGFWNPHASCFDAFGRLFSVDNDPDSRPPCRLLHVIPGGDYGYRYRNGRRGLHPFTSWNGEIPGTLPMVAGTGEAPGGIVAYESDGLPEEYLGNLLVTSWGDHRIDRFRLKPKGASFTSLAEPLIVGGENFRPVGLACAPDGSLYCTDWMLRDYNLHGHGRVWKISSTKPRKSDIVSVEKIKTTLATDNLKELLKSKRLEVRRLAAKALSQTSEGRRDVEELLDSTSERIVIETLNAVTMTLLDEKANDEFAQFLYKAPEHFKTSAEWTYYLRSISNDVPQIVPASLTNFYVFVVAQSYSTNSKRERSKKEEISRAAFLQSTGPLAATLEWTSFGWDSLIAGNGVSKKPEEAGEVPEFVKWFDLGDPFLFEAAIASMAKDFVSESRSQQIAAVKIPQIRLAHLLSSRRRNPQEQAPIRWGFRDADVRIRRAAIQWIAEEGLIGYRPQIEAILNDPALSADLFMATLAALEMLDGVPPAQFDKTPLGKRLLPLVQDERRPAAVRALALRMIDPADPALTGSLLEKLLATNDPILKLETVRSLQFSPVPEAAKLLRTIASDEKQESSLRLEAIAGLASALKGTIRDKETEELLAGFAFETTRSLPFRIEALRSLRGFSRSLKSHADKPFLFTTAADSSFKGESKRLPEQQQELAEQLGLAFYEPSERSLQVTELLKRLQIRRPRNRVEWQAAVELVPQQQPGATTEKSPQIAKPVIVGDPASGRRVFYHVNSAGCYKCHTVNGRGGKVGPDLSTIGRALSREKLLDSILEPSREIAPQFLTWSFETRQGKVHTGMIVHENEGRTVIGDLEGKATELKTIDIVERVPLKSLHMAS